MDKLTKERRSANMRQIRSRDTSPELTVRRIVHALGFRYRLHVRELPGCPDLVLPRLRKVIFVHGCFWHPHGHCRFSHTPKSNLAYWEPKLQANRVRDRRNLQKLRRQGWSVLVVRECETADHQALTDRLSKFLAD